MRFAGMGSYREQVDNFQIMVYNGFVVHLQQVTKLGSGPGANTVVAVVEALQDSWLIMHLQAVWSSRTLGGANLSGMSSVLFLQNSLTVVGT